MNKNHAKIAGVLAGGTTGLGLTGATASLTGPVANLGGYAVAQTIAGSVGLGGPSLSVGIAAVGGPAVVGTAVVVGVGLSVYKLATIFRE